MHQWGVSKNVDLLLWMVEAEEVIERKGRRNKTLWSVHFGVVVVELIYCKCGGIIRNDIW